jgi:hypothetical protein
VRLGVIYDSQLTKRKLGGLPARTPVPSDTLLLVAWGDSEPAGIHINATENRWMLLLFD